VNLLLMPGEHVVWRDVPDGAVQTHVVVMLYVTLIRRRASSSDSGVPGPNALPFE
jgi:2-keto-3-deoxy-galactonokinase